VYELKENVPEYLKQTLYYPEVFFNLIRKNYTSTYVSFL